MKSIFYRSLVGFVCLGVCAPSLADVIHTADGSRLVGIVHRIADGKLTIETQIAGTLEVEASKVTAIDVEQPVAVQFESGDRLVGTIRFSAAEERSVIVTALGEIAFAPERIAYLWPADAESPEVTALKREVEAAKKALEPKWTATLEVGGVKKEGNVDRFDVRGRFDMARKTEKDLLKFYLAAEFTEEEDTRTVNEYRGGLAYEASMTRRTFWFARTDLEFDEFEDIDLRATAAAGLGYYWIREPHHELKNRVGAGFRHETFDSGGSDADAVIDLGLEYRLDVAPWLQFIHSTSYVPDMEDFKDYRLDVDTAALLPLKSDFMKLKLGVRNEYNSRPRRGIERLDNTYYANLVLQLK